MILVDDLLHSGNRIRALDPLFRQEGVVIDRVLVGLLSGRGRDLMAAKGRSVDSVYFIPNMRSWFVESTMYPFIGGDTVGMRSLRPRPDPSGEPDPALRLPPLLPGVRTGAVFRFSCACLENARDILQVLEQEYQATFGKKLTIRRLGAIISNPRMPMLGADLEYDEHLSPVPVRGKRYPEAQRLSLYRECELEE